MRKKPWTMKRADIGYFAVVVLIALMGTGRLQVGIGAVLLVVIVIGCRGEDTPP
jgi:hypothetical protein